MFSWQVENLLPKKLNEGVALNRLASNIRLPRFRGFGKLTKVSHFSKFTKLSLGGLLVLFLSGYQPVATFPPIKKSLAIAQFSQQQTINSTHLSQPFILPHPGYLTTKFSSWHPGVDIATGLGMPIKAIASGKVTEVNIGFFGLGHSVTIEHEQGFKSIYGHLGRVFVKKDDVINSYSIIGEVGMTGHTTGPHTHLEIMRNGEYIDPQTVLPTISDWPASAGLGPKGEGEVKTSPTPTPTPKLSLIKFDDDKNIKTTKLPLLLLSPKVLP